VSALADWLDPAGRLLLAGILALSALGKARDLSGTRVALVQFGVPVAALPATTTGLIGTEAVLALALVLPPITLPAAATAAALFLLFAAAMAGHLLRGQRPDCPCFGGGSGPVSWRHVGENLAFALLAAFLAVPPSPVPTSVVLLLGLAACASIVMRRRSWRRTQMAIREGLPIGAAGSGFALPDLHGTPHELRAILDRGRPVLLIFLEADCPHCRDVVRQLPRWLDRGAGSLEIVLVADDGIAAPIAGALVLVGPVRQVAAGFALHRMPAGMVIDTEGHIASAPAVGSLAIRALLSLASSGASTRRR
jgi:uncharacterized membrane protein YphA (DoxX/SURF4 family)